MSLFAIMLKLLLVLTGCGSSHLEPGILIIAVDGLKAEDVQCASNTENEFRGFNFLCQNFIRVQGLVVNSTSSAANMASLLTGLPPERHGLQQNSQFISAEQVLLPEKLTRRGWRTSFFSGGAPLARRTQLNQGFETFDESIPNSPRWVHRSFEQSIAPFMSWLQESGGRHFSVISVSDLMNAETATISDKGETRPRSLEGQIEEFDESFFHFIDDLRRQNLWNNGWVIVVGLSGRPDLLDKTPTALQIHPGRFLVPLFIRPPAHVTIGDTGPERTMQGVWSLTQLSDFLEDIANEIDTPASRQNPTPMQMLKDREASLVKVEACSGKICRNAFSDQKAWLVWESPLNLDLPGRKDLLEKIKKTSDVPSAPPRLKIDDSVLIKTPKFAALADCLTTVDEDSNARLCTSKSVQALRAMSQLRQNLLARPESLREQKIRFLHDWSQLSSASQIYRKLQPTGLYLDLRNEPLNEYATLQTLLERPEFRDIQREALRAIPVR